MITPIFLYNSEIWTLSKKDKTKIDTFQRHFLRQIVRNRKTKNVQLYKICHTKEWSLTIQERRIKWFGHLQRLPKEAPAKLAYEEVTKKPVKKLKGGQPLTWLKTIERDLNSINLTVEEARNIAQDRDRYLQEVVIRVRDEAESKSSQAHPEDSSQV